MVLQRSHTRNENVFHDLTKYVAQPEIPACLATSQQCVVDEFMKQRRVKVVDGHSVLDCLEAEIVSRSASYRGKDELNRRSCERIHAQPRHPTGRKARPLPEDGNPFARDSNDRLVGVSRAEP